MSLSEPMSAETFSMQAACLRGHELVAERLALILQRLEKMEERLSQIETRLNQSYYCRFERPTYGGPVYPGGGGGPPITGLHHG
jgi:hypothetical protein